MMREVNTVLGRILYETGAGPKVVTFSSLEGCRGIKRYVGSQIVSLWRGVSVSRGFEVVLMFTELVQGSELFGWLPRRKARSLSLICWGTKELLKS